MTPQRIQRKRTRGWRMPAGAVYVGRPTKWGNPFKLPYFSRNGVLAVYDAWLMTEKGKEIVAAAKRELRGHDLCCWCKPGAPCHADVLLRIANEGDAPKPLDADAAP